MSAVWEWITEGSAFLLGALKVAAAGIVARILATFGLSAVTFNSLLPSLKDFILQFTGQLPPEVMSFFGAIGIGIAMSMILSALTVRMAWRIFIIPTAVANQLGGG